MLPSRSSASRSAAGLCFHRVESYSAYDGLPVRRPSRTARTTDFQSVGQVVQRVRRTSSPSAKSYRWNNGRDGLEVRRTRRSKRKLAAKHQATAFLRVQTSDSNKDSVEIKLPPGISILVPVSAVESIAAILTRRLAMYLESVITHILRGTAKTEEMLPDRWKAAHPEAVREYREQERRDKADTAVVQAARRRVRAELRKGK